MLSVSVTRVEMLEHTKKSCVLNLSVAAGLGLNNACKRLLDSFIFVNAAARNKINALCGFVVPQSDQHMPVCIPN